MVAVYLKWVFLAFTVFLLFKSLGKKNSSAFSQVRLRNTPPTHRHTHTHTCHFTYNFFFFFFKTVFSLQTFDIFRNEDSKFGRKVTIFPVRFL